MLLVTGSLRRRDRGQRLEQRFERYYRAGQGIPAADDEGVVAVRVGPGGAAAGRRLEQRLAWRLDLAGIARKPAEWVLLGAAASLVLAVLLTFSPGTRCSGSCSARWVDGWACT